MPENGWIKNNFLFYYMKAFLKRSAFFMEKKLKAILMICNKNIISTFETMHNSIATIYPIMSV
jgi:hypothetical protein